MTSHRRGWLPRAFAALLVAALAGCASLPDDAPVVEKLDADTGLTITRLGKPVELFRETLLLETAGRFAFLGPFETNQMGSRESYLWLSTPVEPAPNTQPVLEVNGATLPLVLAGRDPQTAGLTKSPYKVPTPWSSTFYYRVDAATVARLGEATQITLRLTEAAKSGNIQLVFAAPVNDPRLRDYSARQSN